MLKIIDFGMSKYVKRRQYFRALRGTPYYIAPEVISGQYNQACDMWSFGVVMFVMLFGYPPFHAENDNDIFNLILAGFTPVVKKGYRAHFPMAIPCSDAAKDLISKLLTMDTAVSRNNTHMQPNTHTTVQRKKEKKKRNPPTYIHAHTFKYTYIQTRITMSIC